MKQNYRVYCKMIEATLELNIERSIMDHVFTPDEYQYLLAQYTDQVPIIHLFHTHT